MLGKILGGGKSAKQEKSQPALTKINISKRFDLIGRTGRKHVQGLARSGQEPGPCRLSQVLDKDKTANLKHASWH